MKINMQETTFAILISTKNRINDLAITLAGIDKLFPNLNLECVIYDDGSTDGTFEYVASNFPQFRLLRNETSKGYIFCRNKMLNETKADFAISLDDDANFVTENPLNPIANYFAANPKCGAIGFRIFWGLQLPDDTNTKQQPHRMKAFVGCGHIWRMEAWRAIPNYPEWFVFYGEEEFASKQLFQKNIEVHYFPEVLVHHRVDVKSRKINSDYTRRLKYSLRSGWLMYCLFDPIVLIPRKLAYSVWMQFKTKVFKGDWRAAIAIIKALSSVLFATPKIIRSRKAFTKTRLREYESIAPTEIYWQSGK
ncbi:glycosyltransferase family 2 protein [Flavobacterium sp. 3HN19-14]|uniref:glycosyltransferase family 2 protein n=1 Tax=Flavobacterium sp. 3HN19-14 TaxID=3448133 RepID=UPI003EDE9FC8